MKEEISSRKEIDNVALAAQRELYGHVLTWVWLNILYSSCESVKHSNPLP